MEALAGRLAEDGHCLLVYDAIQRLFESRWGAIRHEMPRHDPGRFAPSRLSLMMMLAGGLYLGPFLAGLSGQPGWTVAAFAAVLALWSMLYRTASWPRRFADLARPQALAMTVLLACVMLVIAGLFFLAGLGLSMIARTVSLPPAVPLAIPILSLVVAMFVQSPRKAAEMDAFLDDALRQIKSFTDFPPASEISLTAKAAAAKLERLPERATEAEVRAAIGGAGVHDAALLAAIDNMGVPPPRPARLAAILIVTDPEGAPGLTDRGEAGWVFDTLHGDPELEALFARRALALLAEAPHLWREMPYAYDVDQAAASSSDPEAALLLNQFRDRLNELSLSEEDADEVRGAG